jgi:hypothetical protein
VVKGDHRRLELKNSTSLESLQFGGCCRSARQEDETFKLGDSGSGLERNVLKLSFSYGSQFDLSWQNTCEELEERLRARCFVTSGVGKSGDTRQGAECESGV